jgi:beta-lactamase regulating signal transducer with metallopeptidase domain
VHILLNWIFEGSVVAMATAGGLRLLRGAPAATRHAACWAALAAVLSLPFMPLVWSAALVLTSAPAAATASAGMAAIDGDGAAPLVRLPAIFSVTSVLLGAAWMLWTMLQVVRVVRDVRWVQRARRRCRALPEAVAARFSPTTTRLLAATGARVVLCDAVRAAAVLGNGRPVVGLHRRLVGALSDRELNAVLVHELAHVLRRDSRATMVLRAVHVLVGWHPGVWWVMRRLALEREMACDEAAVAEAGGRKAYATCLTRLAALAQRAALLPDLALGMLPASGLRRRVLHVLTPGRFSRRTAGWASGTLCTSLGALALAMGTVVIVGEPAVANGVGAFETVTSGIAHPLRDVLPSNAHIALRRAAMRPVARRSVSHTGVAMAAASAAAAAEPVALPAGDPPARVGDPPIAASAPQAPVPPADITPAGPAERVSVRVPQPAPQAPLPETTPNLRQERTVTDAAVAAAAGATGAWNTTTDAAAQTGVAVGRTTQKGAVATAGAFARWGRRIASSF